MAPIPLGGSEETHVIFGGDMGDHLSDLTASEQKDLLTRLQNIASSEAPPDNFIYEQIGNIAVVDDTVSLFRVKTVIRDSAGFLHGED